MSSLRRGRLRLREAVYWPIVHTAPEEAELEFDPTLHVSQEVLGFAYETLPCKGRELISSLQEVKVPVVRFAFKEKSGSHLNPRRWLIGKKNHIYLLAWTIYSKLTGT